MKLLPLVKECLNDNFRTSRRCKMAGVKQQVIQMIQSLPEEVTIDDIMAELYFKLQVDAGLRELDEGKGIPHEEIEKRMSKWLTK
jgi:predicted transcriptional regulator